MKKRILSLILILVLALPCGVITVQAVGNDPYEGFSAVSFDEHNSRGIFSTSTYLGGLRGGEWICYKQIDFGDTSPYEVEVSVGVPGGYAESLDLRLDSPTGAVIATVPIEVSGWETPKTNIAPVSVNISGVHDLYIMLSGSCNLFDIKFYKFEEPGLGIPEYDSSDAYSDIADDENRRAINILNELGILRDYESGNFEGLLPVRRGEFAYSVFKLYGVEEVEGLYPTKFTDVPSDGYDSQAIAYLSDIGIINGITSETFRPNDFICYVDALAVICRVLGYGPLVEEYGGYPTGYLRVAAEQKLSVSNIGATDYLRRTDMAAMLYSAFDANALTMTGIRGDNVTYEKVKGLLYRTQEMYIDYGKVNANFVTDLYVPETDAESKKVIIDDTVYKLGMSNASALIGAECEFYYNEDKNGEKTIKAIFPMNGVDITEITPDTHDIESIDNDKIVYYNQKGKKVKFEIKNDTAVLYNGVAIDDSVENIINSETDFCGKITLIDNRSGSDTVIIDEYVNYIVDSINIKDKFIVDKNTGSVCDLNDGDATVYIKKMDKIVEIDKLEPGDVLSVYASKNRTGNQYIRAYVINDEIFGKIEIINASDNTVVINGTEYKVSPYLNADIELDLSGVFKLDVSGCITGYTYSKTSDRLIGLYLDSLEFSQGLTSKAKVQMALGNGEPEVFEFADKVTIDGIRFKDVNSIINGNGSWAGLAKLEAEKPVCYTLNDENKIIWMDTLLVGDGGSSDTLKQITQGNNVMHSYEGGIMAVNRTVNNANCSIGRYFIPETATLIMYFADASNINDNWLFTTVSGNISRSARPEGEAYSSFGDNYSGDIFVWRNRNTSTSHETPFVFTGISQTLDDDGNVSYKVKGVKGKAKLTYILPGEAYDSGILKNALPGDVIRVKLNNSNEIFLADYLVFRDGVPSRNGSTALGSVNSRLSTGTNRDNRWVFGEVAEKGDEYFAVDLGTYPVNGVDETAIEIITSQSAQVSVVRADGRNGEYVVEYGMNESHVAVGDTIFAFLQSGKTISIVVFKDINLRGGE